MKKYKQAAISIAFLTIILSAGICSGYIIPKAGEKNKSSYNQQEAILIAFENNDYNAWKKIVSRKGNICNVISKDDFDKFIKARKAARSGNYDEAILISKKVEEELKNKLGSKYFI